MKNIPKNLLSYLNNNYICKNNNYEISKKLFKSKENKEIEDSLPRIPVTDVLTSNQIKNANRFYKNHKEHVDKIMKETTKSYELSESEDKIRPELWKPEYWRWFFNI